MARPRQISDEQILEAMRIAVEAHGPAVSLDVVAKELGVSQPALLKRFGTRKRLMIESLRLPPIPYADTLEAGPDTRPVEAQLLELLQAMEAFSEQCTPRFAALRESGIPMSEIIQHFKPAEPMPILIQRGLTKWLTRAVEMNLLECDDPQTLAFAFVAAISARSHLQYMYRRPFTRGSTLDFLKSLIALYVRPSVRNVQKRRPPKPLSPSKPTSKSATPVSSSSRRSA